MQGIVKRVIGAVLVIAALFLPLPSPLSDMNAKIFLIFLGISLIGHEIFFTRRNIVAFILFFCAVSSILPIDLAPRIILFILALDLITFPLIPSTPIIDVSKIVGRVFLIIILFGLNAIGFGKLGIDVAQIILFVVILTASDVILSFFSFGIIPWKAIIIFIIGLVWVFNWNWTLALIPAIGEFILNKIL